MKDTPQIFISYSRRNVERAREIFASLGWYVLATKSIKLSVYSSTLGNWFVSAIRQF